MELNANMLAALQKATVQPRWFLWVKAKNRNTGATEESGLWTGIGDFTTTVDGQSRTYRGAGGLLDIQGIVYAAGTNIQSQSVGLSILDPNVIAMLRVYEPKLASAEIHLGLIDAETEAFVGITQAFTGYIDTLNISESFEDANAQLTLVSSMRNGSKALYLKQSDAAQRLRDPNDEGREYSSIAKAVKVFWGIEGNSKMPVKTGNHTWREST